MASSARPCRHCGTSILFDNRSPLEAEAHARGSRVKHTKNRCDVQRRARDDRLRRAQGIRRQNAHLTHDEAHERAAQPRRRR